MKKFRLLFVAAIAIASVKGFSQVNVDMGKDWDPVTPALIDASSGAEFVENQLTYTVLHENTSVNFIIGGGGLSRAASGNSVYINDKSYGEYSYAQLANGTNAHFIEGNVEVGNIITSIKLNGTSVNAETGKTAGIVYSDKTPFDETSITGYENVSFAPLRAGNDGVTITTIPSGTKSFRLYNVAKMINSPSGNGYELTSAEEGEFITAGVLGQGSLRLAYISATVSPDNSSSVEYINNDKPIVEKIYYNLSGLTVPAEQAQGMLIEKAIYEDGSSSYSKVYINQ